MLKEREKYERYYYDDEIDLVELLKTIIKEIKLVFVITIIFTIISIIFAVYRENLPKTYTASITLKDDTYGLLLSKNSFLYNGSKDISTYIQKVNFLIKKEKIDNYIVSNNIIKLQTYEDKTKSKVTVSQNIKNLSSKNFIISNRTKEKTLVNIQKDIKNKTELLSSEINNLFKKNIDIEIIEAENNFEVLKREAIDINSQIKKLIEENKLVLTEKTLENFSLIAPNLYVKFNENKEQMKICYANLQDLNFLKKISNKEDIFTLKFESIKFENSKLNTLVILVFGVMLGLFAGIFIAIIKEPFKNILKEVKE